MSASPTTPPASRPRTNLWAGFVTHLRDWGLTEGLSWVYIAKAVTAGLLAMYIAMRLELPSPRTALTTVFVVMTPQSGMVLAKSFYRIIGTLVGLTAMLTLISLFSQAHVLFLLGTAIWIGICTAGSARNRNFRSYGFLLAGYTAALIGVSNAEAPLGAFDASVTRVLEVSLGIICSAVVSSVVFPRQSASLLRAQLRSRFTSFLGFVHDASHAKLERSAVEKRNMAFIGEVVGLESLRSYSIFEEPLVRMQSGKLGQLNSESMAASTRFHALHQLLNRIHDAGNAPLLNVITPFVHELGECVWGKDGGKLYLDEGDVSRLIDDLAAFRDNLPGRMHRVRLMHTLHTTPADSWSPAERRDFDTAGELLYRFVIELYRYAQTHRAVRFHPARGGVSASETTDNWFTRKAKGFAHDARYAPYARYPRYTPKTNGLMAAIAGTRAAITLLLVSAFWYFSSWPAGDFATLTAGTVCALISASPQPARAAVQMVGGSFLAVCFGYLVDFVVFPGREGFLLMAAGMAPALMFGAWVTTRPKYVPAGLGYCIFFCLLAGPDNLTAYDPISFLNNGVALVIAMMISAVSFGILLPPTTRWLIRRMEADLRRQVTQAAFSPLPGLPHRLDNQARDFMFQIGGLTAENPTLQRHMLRWMFAVLEIGHALIELRNEFDALPKAQRNDPRYLAKAPWRSALRAMRQALVELFTTPNAQGWARALHLTDNAIAQSEQMLVSLKTEASAEAEAETEAATAGALDQERLARHRVQRIVSYLHFVRTALLDEHSPLAALHAAPGGTSGPTPGATPGTTSGADSSASAPLRNNTEA